MTRKLATLFVFTLFVAAPAQPFWGAFFSAIGNAVGNAFGLGGGGLSVAGLMPVSVKEARPVVEAARDRLQELRRINAVATSTLDHYSGVAGTLRDLGSLARFRAEATRWLQSSSADRYGTSGGWTSVLNGSHTTGGAVAAYGRASEPVPDWTSALPTLPSVLQDSVRREHATIELADAVSVRSMSVLGEMRRTAPDRRRAHDELERAALDPSNGSQALPALLGKVSVGQVRQIRGTEQTNQLLDALVEADLAALKRDRDRLARSMNAAAEYRAMAAVQPAPSWRMP